MKKKILKIAVGLFVVLTVLLLCVIGFFAWNIRTIELINRSVTGTPQEVENAIERVANVNRSFLGATPIFRAAQFNPNPEVITTILNLGADPKARRNNTGSMAIDLAKENPHLANTDALRQLEQASR